MVRKRSPTNKDVQPPRIDDLKLINGIGPRVEKRLNDHGILTFVHLAAKSPADIAAAVADLAGLTTERIIKQDWIGQAHKLAVGDTKLHVEDTIPVEPPATPKTIERAQIITSFVEPEQSRELTAEAISDAAHEGFYTPAESEQDVSFATPIESAASTEHTTTTMLSVEKEIDAVPPIEHNQPITFTVELILDENNNVDSTHILNNQSGHEFSWAGWQNTKLVNFMIESAALNVLSDEPTLLVAEEPAHSEGPELKPVVVSESRSLTPLVEKALLTGTPRLLELEIIRVDSSPSRRTLAINEPFDVRLTLDLTELQMPGDISLNYKASIYGKGQGRPGLVVGEVQGSLVSTGTVAIKVERNTLPFEGIYKLVAQVIVGLPGDELKVRPGTTAVIDGGEVLVY